MKGEGGIALLVIVSLLLGGIVWWLYSSRQDAVKNARAFATEVTRRVAVNYDEKFLHVRLSPEAQMTYLKSWRDRLLDHLRELGLPAQPMNLAHHLPHIRQAEVLEVFDGDHVAGGGGVIHVDRVAAGGGDCADQEDELNLFLFY